MKRLRQIIVSTSGQVKTFAQPRDDRGRFLPPDGQVRDSESLTKIEQYADTSIAFNANADVVVVVHTYNHGTNTQLVTMLGRQPKSVAFVNDGCGNGGEDTRKVVTAG